MPDGWTARKRLDRASGDDGSIRIVSRRDVRPKQLRRLDGVLRRLCGRHDFRRIRIDQGDGKRERDKHGCDLDHDRPDPRRALQHQEMLARATLSLNVAQAPLRRMFRPIRLENQPSLRAPHVARPKDHIKRGCDRLRGQGPAWRKVGQVVAQKPPKGSQLMASRGSVKR